MLPVAFNIYYWFEDTLVQDPKGLQKNHFYKPSRHLTWVMTAHVYKWHFKINTCLSWHLKIISLSFYLFKKHLLNFYCAFALGYHAPGVNSKQGTIPGSQSGEWNKQVSSNSHYYYKLDSVCCIFCSYSIYPIVLLSDSQWMASLKSQTNIIFCLLRFFSFNFTVLLKA